MNMLPNKVIDQIAIYDREKHNGPNRTRFYTWLLPNGPDIEVHTVAVKAHRDGRLAVKEVMRASVDEPWLLVLDLAFVQIAGYSVDWSPEGFYRDWRYEPYRGKWSSVLYDRRSRLWKIRCPVINPWALTDHERFRWCAWDPATCGHVLDYLKAYVEHPRIEMLAKAGLGWLATRTGFVSQMERDAGLRRFVLANMEAIKERLVRCTEIRTAYRYRITLAESHIRCICQRKFRGLHLPAVIDPSRAMAFVTPRRVQPREYAFYVRNCERLGLDLADTRVAFPRDFRRRERIIADTVAELDRQANAEAARKADREIAEAAARYAAMEGGRGAMLLVLPRRSSDFVREGKALHHCIGDGHYAAKMARGETLIAFVRRCDRPRVPFVSVEFDLGKCRVLQAYGKTNSRPDPRVIQFIERCAALLKEAQA